MTEQQKHFTSLLFFSLHFNPSGFFFAVCVRAQVLALIKQFWFFSPPPPQLFCFFLSNIRALFVFFALFYCFLFLFLKRSLMELARFKAAESYHSSSGRNLRRRLSWALLQKTPLISLTLWPPHDSLVKERNGGGSLQRGGNKKWNFSRLLHQYSFCSTS